jgi:hypothetical protein
MPPTPHTHTHQKKEICTSKIYKLYLIILLTCSKNEFLWKIMSIGPDSLVDEIYTSVTACPILACNHTSVGSGPHLYIKSTDKNF